MTVNGFPPPRDSHGGPDNSAGRRQERRVALSSGGFDRKANAMWCDDTQVIAAALRTDLSKEQFHVVFASLLGGSENEIAEDLGLDRDRVHQIKRTAYAKMRRQVRWTLNLPVAA